MLSLESIAGVDPADPQVRLAVDLAREDRSLLRRLVALRRVRSLSQRDVAERLGITQPAVAAFERHDADPKLSTIRRYAQVIGASIAHTVQPRWQTVHLTLGTGSGAGTVTPVADSAYAARRTTLHLAGTTAA